MHSHLNILGRKRDQTYVNSGDAQHHHWGGSSFANYIDNLNTFQQALSYTGAILSHSY